MDKGKKKKRDEWVRMASKSHQGRFYMFNKATGETQWLPSKDKDDTKDSPPKLSINKANKTPAQDRLKRLQHSLKVNQTKPHTMRPTAAAKNIKSKEQKNEVKDGPSTSCKAKALPKSPKRETKRYHSASISNETNSQIKRFKPSALHNSNEFNVLDSEKAGGSTSGLNKSVILKTCTEIPNSENLQNVKETKISKLSDFSFGLVKKIKDICKMPFNASKKSDEQKLVPAVEKSSGTIKTTLFKATSKTKLKQCVSTSAKQEAIINQIKEETAKSSEDSISNNSLVLSTPKNNIPSYPRGSANSRLERLKRSLLSQQQSHKLTNSCDISSIVPIKSTETNNNIKAPLQEEPSHNSDNNSPHSSNNTVNSTKNDEIEAMDWQSIDKEEKPIEETSFEPTLVVEKSKKLLLNKSNANGTMGDIIDTVNENLLRFSAEKQKDYTNNNKWRKKLYYFIVDTNVLLRDLTFLEDLTKVKLCDTEGSILYIPYSVLQELDKLKMRSGLQEGVKTLAVRAIKYLNSKFESNSPHVQAQSALDERHHLIDINSADDSIMNCCLQAKKNVPHLLLLTEDVNLRNKAICNNIMVSTKSDLIAKRYDSCDRS